MNFIVYTGKAVLDARNLKTVKLDGNTKSLIAYANIHTGFLKMLYNVVVA